MKDLIENLLKFFGITHARYDNGQKIFYPWCPPGEGFILADKKFIKYIDIYSALLSISFLSSIIVANIISDWEFMSTNMLWIMGGVIISIHSLFYFLLIIQVRKKCKLYTIPEFKRSRRIPFISWVYPLFQLQSIRAAYLQGGLSDPLTLILLLLLIGSTFLTISVLVLIIKTRGYVFEKTGLFSS